MRVILTEFLTNERFVQTEEPAGGNLVNFEVQGGMLLFAINYKGV